MKDFGCWLFNGNLNKSELWFIWF